jgi:excisionase family DNA binding protein
MKKAVDSCALALYSLGMDSDYHSEDFQTGPGSAILVIMSNAPISEYVTTTEAAEILGVHRSRVFPLIRSGRIEAKKVGPMWFILRSSLDNVRERTAGYPKGRPRKID